MATTLRVLLVEDSEDDALLLERELRRSGFDVNIERVETPRGMSLALADGGWDLVVADYRLPTFNGLSALRLLKATGRDLPFIIVSGTIGEDLAVEAMRAGAHDYVMKGNLTRLGEAVRRELREASDRRARRRLEEAYQSLVENSLQGLVILQEGRITFANQTAAELFGLSIEELLDLSPNEVQRSVHADERALVWSRFADRLEGKAVSPRYEFRVVRRDGQVRWVEMFAATVQYSGRPATQAALVDVTMRKQRERELALAYDTTLEGWARALELRDRETEGHTRRVTELTLRLGRAMGVGDDDLVNLRRGAILHDIGKMGVPDSILLKPGPPTEEEWEVLRQHPEHARRLLAPIEHLRPALDIPYCHHERWDGTGYPRGLAGEEIPLAARIFAVADVWDALLSDRPYRKAWGRNEVVRYIHDNSGTHFDARVVEVFLSMPEAGEETSGR